MSESMETRPTVGREASSGNFVVLYGVNNLGKSTQLELLIESLKSAGGSVAQRKSPNYDIASGHVINQILREGRNHTKTELQLWQAINMHQEQTVITETIAVGATLVSEDYWGTTIAWGLGSGVARDVLDAMTCGLRAPDVAILLHGQRFTESTEAGHLHETNDSLTDRVQQHHLELADELGWHKVNANQSVEAVHQEIIQIVQPKVIA